MGFMSNPLTGLFMGGLSTGASTAAAYNQAKAENMASEWNAMEMEQNAQLSRLRADNFRQLGEIEEADVLRKYGTIRGEQRATYGASGVDVNSGSAAEVQASTAAEGVYEGQKTRYDRSLQAWEADMEAQQLEGRAKFTRASKVNPYVPAATSALSGLSGAYYTYGQRQRTS